MRQGTVKNMQPFLTALCDCGIILIILTTFLTHTCITFFNGTCIHLLFLHLYCEYNEYNIEFIYSLGYKTIVYLMRNILSFLMVCMLTLKAPITTAADDKFCDIFPYFKEIRNDNS